MVVEQMENVFPPPGKKVVHADHFVAFAQKSFAEMRADKPGPAGYKYSHKYRFRVSSFEFERAGAGPLPNCKCIALRQISPVEYRNSTNQLCRLEGGLPPLFQP